MTLNVCVCESHSWLAASTKWISTTSTTTMYTYWQLCECAVVTLATRPMWRHHIRRGPVDTIIDVMFGMVLISQPLANWPVIVQMVIHKFQIHLDIFSVMFFSNHTISLRQSLDCNILREVKMERQRCLLTFRGGWLRDWRRVITLKRMNMIYRLCLFKLLLTRVFGINCGIWQSTSHVYVCPPLPKSNETLFFRFKFGYIPRYR